MNDTQRLSTQPMPSGQAIRDAYTAFVRSMLGICIDCGVEPQREDSVYCDPCWRGEEA